MSPNDPVTSRPRGRLRERIPAGPAWTLADQALSSGANFLSFVVLARTLSPGQLGVYALAFTGLYVLGNFQRALFVEPHYVHGPRHDHYRSYTTATAAAQALFAASWAIAAIIAAGVARLFDMDAASTVLMAFAAAVIPYLTQEFMRGVFFTEARFRAVFANDVVSYGGQLALVVLLAMTLGATPVHAMHAIGISSGVAVLVGLWQLRGSATWPISFRATIQRNWHMGRWLFASSIVTVGARELLVFLSSGILGIAAAGGYRSVVTILNVNNVFLTALIGRTLPRASERLRDAGGRGLDAFLMRLIVRDAVPIYVLSALVFVFAEQLLGTLYGDGYRSYASVLRLLSLVPILAVPVEVMTIGLMARGLAAPALGIATLSACISIAVGIPMTQSYGLEGLALTRCLDVVILLVFVSIIYTRVRRRAATPFDRSGAATPDEARIQEAPDPSSRSGTASAQSSVSG